MKAAAAPVPKARKKTMKAKPMKARLRLDRSDETAKRAKKYQEMKKEGGEGFGFASTGGSAGV